MPGIEEGRHEEESREGVTQLGDYLMGAQIVSDNERALEIAESISRFAGGSFGIRAEEDAVNVGLCVEGGNLQICLGPKSTTVSFSKGRVKKNCNVDSAVMEVQFQHPFLNLKFQGGGLVRAVREYNSISIEHFDFVPNLV